METLMIRIPAVLIAAAIILLQTVSAVAESTTDAPNLRTREVYYISLKGGMTAFSDISFNDFETIADISVTGIEYTMATLMFNGYYDFETHSDWRPYIGAGIGAANIFVDVPGSKDDAYAIAYKLGAGLGVDVSRHMTFDLGYMLLLTSDFSLTTPDGEFVESIAGHTVTLGVRFLIF